MCRQVLDDVFGIDYVDEDWKREQAANRAAAEAAAAAAQQPAAPGAPAAPATPTAPAAPVAEAPAGSPFDATPWKSQIDQGFSQFTPEFYANKFASIYNPYKAGVESQYGSAKDALEAGVAKRGLADSQQGRGLFQQLDSLRDQAFTTGQNAAQGFQTSLSDAVDTAKKSLYGGLGAGADNAGTVAKAPTEAARIAGTKAPSNSLGDVFGGLVAPYAASRSPGGPVNPAEQAFATGSSLNLADVGGGPEASTKTVNTPQRRRA